MSETPTVVPGATPGTTPPIVPSPGDDQQKRILQMILQAAKPRQKFSGQPRPAAVPGKNDPFSPPSYMTNNANPHAWGGQRLMYGVQQMIKNAVSHHKEDQINKAMADWTYAESALNEFYNAQASGDPKAIEQANKKIDAVFGDPKKLKNMAKALNQDWLNPEKTTPYGEALKRVAAESTQRDGKKQQAKGGLMNVFRSLMGQNRQMQVQLTEQERQRMAAEIRDKAPSSSTAPTPKESLEMAQTVLDIDKAQKELRESYGVMASPDGTMWYFNKSNPKDAHIMRDAESGEEIKGKTASKEGTLVMAQGIPIGVVHGGHPVLPGEPGWTKHDDEMMTAAKDATQEKQRLRLPYEIAAQVGQPPNPADYKKQRNDPEYAKALKEYGEQIMALKLKESTASAIARAKTSQEWRVVQTMDADGNVYYDYARNAIGQSPASEGIKLKPREVQINDIEVASQHARDAINKLDSKFSAEQIAQLHTALSTPDETIATAEITALATSKLTDDQQDFVVWIKQLNERAMSLRNVAGMGAGAQDLRDAIRAMLPGVRSGSKSMMKKQLDAFDNQVKILKKGIAHPGKEGGGNVIVVKPEDMK